MNKTSGLGDLVKLNATQNEVHESTAYFTLKEKIYTCVFPVSILWRRQIILK